MRLPVLVIFCMLCMMMSTPLVRGGAHDAGAHMEQPADGFTLSAAYPNPFTASTTFSLTVDVRQQVSIEIFNVLGQRVELLFQGLIEEGETRTFVFDGGELPSGIYLYRASGERFVATRHITLLK